MKTWLVNTNTDQKNGNPNGFKYMLRQNKAAAFYDRAIRIDQIVKGDLVCLYHNQNRIIAVGAVVNPYAGHDFTEIQSIEHWVDVNWLWRADFDESYKPKNPIYRADINIAGVNGTVIDVTNRIDYQALFAEIAKRQNF